MCHPPDSAPRQLILLLVAFACLALTGEATAAVRLPAVLADNMVLQRDQPIPVWGWADAGESVTVTLGELSAKTCAGKDGRWSLRLPASPANIEEQDLIVAGSNRIVLKRILIGEVWLASGQSNMAMTARKTINWAKVNDDASDAQLRVFRVLAANASPMKPVDDCRGVWEQASESSIANVSAVGYYFARRMRKELGVPVGLIHAAWGGSCAEHWTSRQALLSHDKTRPLWQAFQKRVDRFDPATLTPKDEAKRLLDAFKEKALEAKRNKTRRPKPPVIIGHPTSRRFTPANFFNTLIHPLIPYGIRGVLWYQGESNRERAEQYETLLPIMIADWRRHWGKPAMPFGIVQLANIGGGATEPVESAWAELQFAQWRVVKNTPHTGLAVINDSTDTSLHPRDKKKAGDRLALWALAKVYIRSGAGYSGPSYRHATVQGRVVRIAFDHAKGLRSADGKPLHRFQIAGADRQWVFADATIDGDTVVVSSKKIAKPVAVRYAWAGNPQGANLTNATGLPASLFKTDDWPGVSHGKLLPEDE